MSSPNEKSEFNAMLSILLDDLQKLERKIVEKKDRNIIISETTLLVQSLSFLRDFNVEVAALATKSKFYEDHFIAEKKKNLDLVTAIFALFNQHYPGVYKYDLEVPEILTGHSRKLILPIFHKNGNIEIFFFPGMDKIVLKTFADCCKAAGLKVIAITEMGSTHNQMNTIL
jgi:hypothetical protein